MAAMASPWLVLATGLLALQAPPYYHAGPPLKVAVSAAHDALLASPQRADVLRARDEMAAQPAQLTPMALMVLALRLHALGEHGDAAFWYHAARYRWRLLAAVVDVQAPQLLQPALAMAVFEQQAGPAIVAAEAATPCTTPPARQRALAWAQARPEQAMFFYQYAARPRLQAAMLAHAQAVLVASAALEPPTPCH